MESDPNKTLRSGDAFLLGYLPLLLRGHFQALEILEQARMGADGELAKRVEAQLRALPERGPEIVSCVWQIENILGERLRVQPPAPPQTTEQVGAFSRTVAAALEVALAGKADERLTAYEIGVHCGVYEALIAAVARTWSLWVASPGDVHLQERAKGLRESLQAALSEPWVRSDCPTLQSVGAAIMSELGAAVAAAAGWPDEAAVALLAEHHRRIRSCARALESAAWGTPRDSVAAWRDKSLSGVELMRRFAEHYRWSIPCHLGSDSKPEPRVFTFDKRVLMMFSDSQALAERPSFLRSEKPEDQLSLTLPGAALFRWLPDSNVDVVVIDPTDDPAAPYTINYPREMFAQLRQRSDEVALELAACDWSRLDLAPLRAYNFWILVSGSDVRNLIARDCYGRPRIGLFSSEEALEAHLALATSEQASDFARTQRLLAPGHTLFPSMAKLDVAGIVLNPSGPGRDRAFNKKTLEKLAAKEA